MRKLVGLMMVGMMMLVGGCGGNDEESPSFEDVIANADVWQPECDSHDDCFKHGHSFCVQGTCVGDPQPEILPEEGVIADNEDVCAKEDVNEEVDPNECDSHTDCSLGYSCLSGQCMQNASPECLKNEDCNMGIACECKQEGWIACTKHECENYECVETILTEQCEFGCSGKKCLEAECESDAECSALDSTTCDDIWLLTVEGQCYKGQCVANSVSGFACEFGCADGACLSDPEVPACLTDADCTEGGGSECTDAFVLKSYWQFPTCVDGVCEQEVYTYQCAIPCQVGCYECWKDSDCNDGDACTADMCGDHECYYDNACACKADANCDDGNACTADSCANGNCANAPIMGCVQCQANGKCGGAATGCWGNTFVALTNLCATSGYCLANSTECEFGCDANLGCKSQCENAGDCADDDDCTNDSCANGKCLHDNLCYMFGDEESPFYMKKCGTDAECVGTKFGNHCVAETETENSWCQPCFNSLKGDANIACDNSEEMCAWGFVGDDGYWASVFSCVECIGSKDCDDGNPCTEDSCNGTKCEHDLIKGCFACNGNTDCAFKQVCYEYEGVDTEWTWTGKCGTEGKCEIAEKKCLTACAGNACEKIECASDVDCDLGQYCTDKFLCGWSGDLQCKFQCPAGKKYAWVMSAKPDEAVESGTGVFKASPTTLCMWGWENPAFKFNCWDGTNNNGAWSDGDKAVVTCNEENFTVTPDENYGSQGVQVVTFTNVYCGF